MATHITRAPDAGEISVSNPDKVLFPAAGFTKSDLVAYYRRISPAMLPFVRDRAVTLRRFPDGIDGEGFFQKNTPDYFPNWIPRHRQKKEGGTVDYTGIESEAALAYLADQGTIELHAALARAEDPDRPDQIIFDLDPSDDDFGKVQEAASVLRELFAVHDIPCFVKTTGSRGLHLVIPLDDSRNGDFNRTRAWARNISERIAQENEVLATVEQRKEKRGDRVFIDYLRNSYGQTAVAPYSLRAHSNAPVATPLDWREALSTDMTPDRYTLKSIFSRLAQKVDPWADMTRERIALAALPDAV